jgi:ferritin-like protein
MSMTRLEHFRKLADHSWLGRVYSKLKSQEIEMVEQFIVENDHLDKSTFEMKVNRMFLDKDKPRHWKEMSELLTCTNSAL